MSGTTKPNYFDVMRPFGKEGYRKLEEFKYTGFENKKVQLFEEGPAFEMLSMPYLLTSRFIELLPSQTLRLFSFAAKYCYSECLSIRGIEVQVMYTNYSYRDEIRQFPLENGKLIVGVAPKRMTNNLKKMFPFFKTVAFLYNRDLYRSGFDSPDYIVRNYKKLYFEITKAYHMDIIGEFLHPGLDSVEIKIRFSHNFDFDATIAQFELINVKNFSLEVIIPKIYPNGGGVYVPGATVVETIGKLLVQHRPKNVENLYYCYSTKYRLQYGNNYTICVYDEEKKDWKVQALPDERSAKIVWWNARRCIEHVIIPIDPGPNVY